MRAQIHLLLLLFLMMAISLNGFSQTTQQWQWAQAIGGTSYDFSGAVSTDHHGNVYLAGSFHDTIYIGEDTLVSNGNALDILLIKYDSHGNVLWVKSVGGSDEDYAAFVATDEFGSLYVGGGFRSSVLIFETDTLNSNGSEDVFLVKYDSLGNEKWVRTFGGIMSDAVLSVVTDHSGSVYISGGFESPSIYIGSDSIINKGSADVFIAKYDSAGNFRAIKSAGANGYDYIISSSVDEDDNVYIAGYYGGQIIFGVDTLYSNGTIRNMFLCKYDSSGNVVWSKSIGGILRDEARAVTTDKFGNVYLAGFYSSYEVVFGNDTIHGNGNHDGFIAKFNSSGNFLWKRLIIGPGEDNVVSLACDEDANVYMLGYFNGADVVIDGTWYYGNGDRDLFLAKFDSSGTGIWGKIIGGTSFDDARTLAIDSGGTVYITGNYTSPSVIFGADTLMSNGSYDIFIAKISDCASNYSFITALGDTIFCPGGNVTLEADSGYTYLWTTGDTSRQTTIDTTGAYRVVSYLPNGCYEISAPIMITEVAPPVQEICLVSVDSAGFYNQIAWEKNNFPDQIDSFFVYREQSPGSYQKIGARGRNEAALFTDSLVNVDSTNYRYKLSTLDECGNGGDLSLYHQTIYLEYIGFGNFLWSAYRVDTSSVMVAGYNIYKDLLGNGNFMFLQTINGGVTSFFDLNYTLFPNAHYRVVVNWASSGGCFPTGSLRTSASNIVNISTSSIEERITDKSFSLYPNPTKDKLNVRITKFSLQNDFRVEIINTLGQKIFSTLLKEQDLQIDLSGLDAGVYNLQLTDLHSHSSFSKRFVLD